MTLVTFHIKCGHILSTGKAGAREAVQGCSMVMHASSTTSDKNTWCHKCSHHNMHTLPEQEEKHLGRGWHVMTAEAGQPMRLN